MNEEKMMILKMLEEGKITSQEAARLLESLKDTPSKPKTTYSSSPSSTTYKSQGANHSSSDWVKDIEPKVQKAAQVVAKTASSLMDKLSKTLASSDFKTEKELSLDLKVVPQDHQELFLKGKNGSLFLKGYNGDKINLKVYYKTKGESGLGIRLVQMDGKIFLQYEEEYISSIRMEGFIPESYFHNIRLETSNGKIRLETCKTQKLSIVTSNAPVDIQEVDSQTVVAETSNAPISIQAQIDEFLDYTQYQWSLETSNAPIELKIPSEEKIGYRVRATTSLNGIQADIPYLTYTQNEGNYIDAHTLHYERAPKKVDFTLTTSNGPIVLKS